MTRNTSKPSNLTLLLSTTALLSTVLSTVANAENASFYDYAQVKKVTPIYTTIEHRVPHKECWTETVKTHHQPQRHHRQHRNDSATSTLVGGVIGGAIGNAVGHGKKNKRIGTVVGTILGLSVGSDIGRQSRHNSHNNNRHDSHDRYDNITYENVERCEMNYTTETEQKKTGYDVTYHYKGHTYSTVTKDYPGEKMKISVSIRPVSF